MSRASLWAAALTAVGLSMREHICESTRPVPTCCCAALRQAAEPILTKVLFFYARADRSFARGLAKSLGDHGHEPWLGELELAYGDLFIDGTQEELRSAAVLVLLSESSRSSQWVAFELGAATAQGKRIFPVLLSDDPSVVPFQIKRIMYLRATSIQPSEVAKIIHEAL